MDDKLESNGNFKGTEKGLIPENWEIKKFEECIVKKEIKQVRLKSKII